MIAITRMLPSAGCLAQSDADSEAPFSPLEVCKSPEKGGGGERERSTMYKAIYLRMRGADDVGGCGGRANWWRGVLVVGVGGKRDEVVTWRSTRS